MNNRWLITGGAGFIGCNFTNMLANTSDDTIVVLDVLSYAADLLSLQDLIDHNRIVFVKGDICDRELVSSILRKHQVTHIVHFAAESHVDRSIMGPSEFIKTNVIGTYTLLEAAREEGCFFYHVSTDEVYGSLSLDDEAVDELCPYRPNSPYSATKAASDHLVRAWHKTFGLPMLISHCSNNYGKWQNKEKFIPTVILNAIRGNDIPVYGDGLYVRNWIHVDDHCEAILSLIKNGIVGETYNISSHEEMNNLMLVELICNKVDAILGRTNSIGLIRHVTDRPGHDRRYAITSEKIKSQTSWQPKRSLEQSMTDIVGWYYGRFQINK